MPNFDGTGPAGAGSMTGRGAGKCVAQNKEKGFGQRGSCKKPCGQRGSGFRNGMGQGEFSQTSSLDEQEKFLEERLEEIRTAKKNLTDKDA